MSNLTLDRPAVHRPAVHRPAVQRSASRARALPPATGSYVDTDGGRRAPAHRGSFTGTASVVGAYTGRSPRVDGSYTRTER